jgi:hypothetical protein
MASLRELMLDDMMVLLGKNSDVHRRWYTKPTPETALRKKPVMVPKTRADFEPLEDSDLLMSYHEMVMRCYRQR